MSDYLKFRLRQKQILEDRVEWLAHFREVCCPTASMSDFLDEAESEALRSSFYERMKSGVGVWYREYDTHDNSPIVDALYATADRAGVSTTVLLETGVGPIEAPAEALLRNVERLWIPQGRDFALVTRDMRNGLLAERNLWPGPGPRHDQPYFELRAWGVFVPNG